MDLALRIWVLHGVRLMEMSVDVDGRCGDGHAALSKDGQTRMRPKLARRIQGKHCALQSLD